MFDFDFEDGSLDSGADEYRADCQDDATEWELRQIADDEFYDHIADYYDQLAEANLVNWGAESLDEVDHDW